MRKVEDMLTDLGLTATEARLYRAGLSTDANSIKELSTKTKIKRPTVYHSLGTLIDKGLVVEKKGGAKARFSMAPPETVRSLVTKQRESLEQREAGLESLIELLKSEQKALKGQSVLSVQYTGIEGMKIVLDAAFYCKGKHWDIIAPVNNFLREYDKDYAKRYLNVRKYHGITARTLWEFTSGTRELTKEEIASRNPRYMPAVMQGKFKSMMILFDDKVAIFSSFDQLSAILITSADTHALFQAMFEGIWEVSERYA
jgi:predicted transcriptional regulator